MGVSDCGRSEGTPGSPDNTWGITEVQVQLGMMSRAVEHADLLFI